MDVFVETERLLLRRLTDADVDVLVELDADPEAMRYITGGRPTPRDHVANGFLPWASSFYERGCGIFALIEKETGEFVGRAGIHPTDDRPADELELGYRIRRSSWGKGYATEASRALIDKVFTDLGARRVWAQTMTVNAASRRVMEKLGLRYVRTFHLDWDEEIEGTAEGDVEYAITRNEWENRQGGEVA
jgi:RimJ/RimL family protein N-acetyltransferase